MNARVSAGARAVSLPRSVRNLAGFVAGWLFILALAFGMEAARAADVELGATPFGWHDSPQAAADAHWSQTASPDYCPNNNCTGFYPKFLRTEGTNPIKDLYEGYLMCGGSQSIYPRGFSMISYRCPAGTVFQRSTKTCVAAEVQCAPKSETDPPAATGRRGHDGTSNTFCEGACAIAPFSSDDGSVITVEPVGGQAYTAAGSASTRWKVIGMCPASDLPNTADANPEKCQTVNGETVCVGGSTPKNCIKVNGGLSCTSDAGGVCTTPECTAMANAVKNADGSATAKQTEPTPSAPNTGTAGQRATSQISYSQTRASGLGGQGTTAGFDWFSPTTVANSYNGDGSIGDRTTQSGDGDGDGDGDDEGDCDPQTEICGDGEFNAPTNEYGFGDLDSEVQSARDSLTQKIAEVRGQASQMLGGGLPEGAGSLPVATFEVLGRSFTIDLGVYADKLALVGTLILFGAMALAARIILE